MQQHLLHLVDIQVLHQVATQRDAAGSKVALAGSTNGPVKTK